MGERRDVGPVEEMGGPGIVWQADMSLEHGFLPASQEHGYNGDSGRNEAVSGLKTLGSGRTYSTLGWDWGARHPCVLFLPDTRISCLLLTKQTLNFLLFLTHSLEL